MRRSQNLLPVGREVLLLLGRSVHRRFIFSIYEVTLFVRDPSYSSEEIIDSIETKFARMRFLRNISEEDIREGFQETYDSNCASDCEILSKDLQVFLSTIHAVSDGDTIEFKFLKDKTVISMLPDRSIEFAGHKFGRIFLRSWLGEHPPSQRFKRELMNRQD